MSVDFLTCKCCGDNFADCGDYMTCECGEYWCSEECAEEDGFVDEHCEIHSELCDRGWMEHYRETHYAECNEHQDCSDCEHYKPVSCKYCREEDFNDSVLLEYCLDRLDLNREDLIEEYKEDKKEGKI